VGTFPAPAQIRPAATTSVRPSVVGGTTADVVFRGFVMGDQRLYHAHFESGAWGAVATQGRMLTVLPPVAVHTQGELEALFTGTDSHLYDGVISDVAGGGPTAQLGGAASNLPPAAAVDQQGTLLVVWANTDSNLYWAERAAGGGFVGPTPFCAPTATGCLIDSHLPPAVTIGADGVPVAAWIGVDDKKVYTSQLMSGTWSAPMVASLGEISTLSPALAPGLGGAAAELVYVRDSDGKPRHTRLVDGSWQTATTLVPTNLLNTPALALEP
jgi:hypothetical protein